MNLLLQKNNSSFILFLTVLLFSFTMIGQEQNGPNCPSICLGPGGSFDNGNLTVTKNTFYKDLKMKGGTTLTIHSGYTLYVGYNGTDPATQVVDFQNNCIVNIEAGAFLIVNGRLNNSNNSNNVICNGTISVTGNLTSGVGSTISGSGTINASGTVSGDGAISVPVNNDAMIGTIGAAQTICSGTAPTPLTSITNGSGPGTITYEWQSNANGTYITIANATNAGYAPTTLTHTTSFKRRTISTMGNAVIRSEYTTPVIITVTASLTPTANTPTQPSCMTNTGSVTLSDLPEGSWTLKSGSTSIATGMGSSYIITGLLSGTYNFTVTNSSNCISPATNNIVINAAPAVPAQPVFTVTQPTCLISKGEIIISNYNASYSYSVSPTTDVTILTDKITASAGTYTVTATLGNCTASQSVTLNEAAIAAPIFTNVTHPTNSVLTGSFNISNYNASYTYVISPSTGVTISSTGIVTAPAGTYTVTAKSGNCTSGSSTIAINAYSNSNLKTWNGSVDNNWFNPNNWTPPAVPIATDDIIVDNNIVKIHHVDGYDANEIIANCKTLTVKNGGKLTVESNYILKVVDFVKVNSDSDSTLILQNNASLIQVNNTLNTGNISVFRTSSKLLPNDYTYWSSPTTGTQKLQEFSLFSNPKYFLTFSNKWTYMNATQTTFSPGIGYAILAPQNLNTTSEQTVDFQFKGTPNNGNITVPITKDMNLSFSSKLIGNPYPCALDADAFINANIETISGTLYFWAHSISSTSANNYAVYNKTGGTSAAPGHGNTSAPTQFIASGQGFLVEAKKSGDVIFSNDMRSSGSNANFYKNGNTSKTVEKSRIWLNFTNNGGKTFSQVLLGYIQTATNDYDPGFDGAYNNSGKTGFYSLIGKGSYTIQAKGEFNETDTMPLGYVTDIQGSSTISIDKIDGLFEKGQDIFIEDKLLNVVHNLKVSPYTFSTEAGTFDNRFVLKYVNDNSLKLNNFETNNHIIVSSKNQQLAIQSQESIDKVFVYDMLGKEIYKNLNVDSSNTIISNLSDKQVLIVKIVLTSGQSIFKKVII